MCKNCNCKDCLKERSPKRPELLYMPNFANTKLLCENFIKAIENGEYDDNFEHSIYESVMETLYGKNVWEWINSHL